METIVHKLFENRIDEARKKVALESITDELRDRLSKVEGYEKAIIIPNYEKGCVDVGFQESADRFSVYPQHSKISNSNSSKVIKVADIDGAYIKGTTVYDSDDKPIGEALIRTKAIHNKSDYSESLDDAEIRYQSKITTISKLQQYLAQKDKK